MLPARHRLTESTGFSRAVRTGARAGSRTVVVHLVRAAEPEGSAAKVGFVVSRAVGGAVVRNRVKRRLRHGLRERLPSLPPGSLVVVRALPAAAAAGYGDLAADLDRTLTRVLVSTSSGRPS